MSTVNNSHLNQASKYALDFASQGASVIPLAVNSKRPALKSWHQFQYRRPSKRQLTQWFVQAAPSAYGVICGQVSGIVVLDFDEKFQYERFTTLFPHLLDTRIVQTGGRGGYHLYFHVDYPVKSQRLQGGDLQAEGKYVVGAGSIINGKIWQIIYSSPTLHTLTRDELKAVISAFGLPIPQPSVMAARSMLSADFAAAYRNGVTTTGERNNTLFRIACLMRNAGHSVTQAVVTLARLHAQTPPQRGQHQESHEQRSREALATIHSAYTAPPTISDDPKTSRLPNRLREAILSLSGGTAFLRVYEGLLLQGITGSIARQQIISILKGIVGRHSIDTALEMTDTVGRYFFAPLESPAEADTEKTTKKSKSEKGKTTALLSGKNRTRLYQIPSITTLCEHLGVVNHCGDALTQEDLRSAKRYRMALHDAFIRRHPGQHSQTMLATRIGRKTRTLRTYGKALGHQIKPTNTRERIDFRSLGKLLYLDEGEGKPVWGRYLEDENGKRYKPYREIAARLLKTGRTVSLCMNGASIYAAKGVDLNPLLRPTASIQVTAKSMHELRTLAKPQASDSSKNWSDNPRHTLHLGGSIIAQASQSPVMTTETASTQLQPPIPKYGNAMTHSQDEATAYRLHTTFDKVPLSSARWIVEQCGRDRALQLMQRVQKIKVKDVRAYLVKAARNAVGTEPLLHEQSARRQHKNQAIENAAQKLNGAIETISLVNARELVLTYGIEAVEATLRHVGYISSPQRQQPYAIRDRAGFFVSHIRQAWRRLNNAQDFSRPAPKFDPHKPRKRNGKYDPDKEFMRSARRGKTINWSYLEWRCQFWQALGEPDPYFETYSAWFREAGRPLPKPDSLF